MGQKFRRIDIVFDCYRNDSIKFLERQRRSETLDAVRITISNMTQPFPSASHFKRIGAVLHLWLIENYHGEKPVYLGGCQINAVEKCFKLMNDTITDIPELICSYDEADGRIMFHLNHAVKREHFSIAHVMTADTDQHLCLSHVPLPELAYAWIVRSLVSP